jgi:signal transduction histidine kinase
MSEKGNSGKGGLRRLFGPPTIRTKIFGAFALVTIIIGIVGLYAVYGMKDAGRMVVRTFDQPLMAISHARLAKSQFAELRYMMLRRQTGTGSESPAIADAAIDARFDELQEDLDIARRRSVSADGRAAATRLKALTADWRKIYAIEAARPGADWPRIDRMAMEIEREFSVLVNISAGDAFGWRQAAIATVETNQRLQLAGVFAALVLTLVITLLLARQILRPIKAASGAARRIAGGELETPIPKAGRDETGALLDAMTVMQDNLRAMMAREIAEKRSAQRRLVDAIESARSGIVLVGADGVVLLANSQAATMFPAAAAQLQPGRRYEDFLTAAREGDLAPPGPEGRVGDTLRASDGEVKLADGRWIRANRSMVGDGDVVMLWNDISLLKDREANLREAKEKAEAADTAKTHFLTNMSHELRTPLNAIIGFSEMISQEMLGPVGKPQYKGYAGDIVSSGRHLLAIINDILDIAKSQAGTLHIDPKTVAVATLFEECAAIVGHGCTKARLTFDLEAPPAELAIHADPVKSRQILLNLLSNATKFTPAGGTVALRAKATGAEFVDIVVTDTGIGMRPEDIPVALAPFGQIDSRLARKYEGTGLGLPLTKILTELHGGELVITSQPERGTTVRVRMPRRASAARAERRAA